MRSSEAPFVSAISSCFALRNQLDFYDDLIGDNSIPVPILDQARGDFDNQRARLEERLAALDGDRLTLAGQRELIRAQSADSADSGALLLGPVQDLAELLDFQQADVARLQQRLGEVAAQLDAEIGQREFGALRERRTLPTNVGHWDLVKRELIRLPQMTVDYWQRLLSDVLARLAALPARGLVGLGAAILVLCGALWWLYRIGLKRMALLSGAGKSSVPLEALRRSLPLCAPVVIWIAIARTVGVAERPAWLLAAALGLLPLAGFLLHLSTLLFAGASERGRHASSAAFAGALGGPRGRRPPPLWVSWFAAFPCCRRWRTSSIGQGLAVCS